MSLLPQIQCSAHMRPLFRRAFRNISVLVLAMIVLRLYAL